jgi:hypothetical protein
MKNEMSLQSLTLRKRQSYEEMPGRFVAEVRYEGSRGSIVMPLTPDISEKLMEYLAPLLARFGSDAASEIAASVTKALEDKSALTLENT